MKKTVIKEGDYRYTVLEDGTAEITKYKGKAENLVITDMLSGIKVTQIRERAFSNCSSLTSVTVPDSVRNMGANPFEGCILLTKIRVSPDHPYYATIDGVLYEKATKKLVCYPCAFKAQSFMIPQGIVTIGDSAFYGCTSLTSVTIPDSVTTIGTAAFYNCSNLAGVKIPKSVTTIGDKAFYNAEGDYHYTVLEDGTAKIVKYSGKEENLFIADTLNGRCVTAIGDGAFSYCTNLKSVIIPDSIREMDANPFDRCFTLTKIQLSPDHPYYATIDGVLYEKATKKLVCYPCAFKAQSFVIPQGILAIGAAAFTCIFNLESITIPDSVTTIGIAAFLGCGLSNVTIPDSVTTIEAAAFYSCSNLRSVTIPDSVTYIGKEAFGHIVSRENCLDFLPYLTLTVPRDSYAAQYCKDNGLNYTYPDANDWLFN